MFIFVLCDLTDFGLALVYLAFSFVSVAFAMLFRWYIVFPWLAFVNGCIRSLGYVMNLFCV